MCYNGKVRLFSLRLRLLAGTLVLLLVACGLEMPRAVQVSAAFGLHIPVGDIGELDEVKEMLEYTKIEKISSLFNSDGTDDVKVDAYYYTKNGDVIPLPKAGKPNRNAEDPLDKTNAINPGEVRSMFIHFPLTSMNLDLTDYLKNVTIPPVEVPDVSTLVPGSILPVGYPLASPHELDTLTVPLDAMSEWIEYVKLDETLGNTTAVIIEGGAALKDMLEMAVPAFNIGSSPADFKPGVIENNDLVFYAQDEEMTLFPKIHSVEIYLRLTKVPPSGGPYTVHVDLKWTEASVNPGDEGVYKGTIPLPLGQFSEFFKKYQIASIPCYLYVGGPFDEDSDVGLKLKAGSDWLVGKENGEEKITRDFNYSLLYENSLENNEYDGVLRESTASFNLASKMNNGLTDDLVLDYQLRVYAWEVSPADETLSVISADMVVILPLQFNLVEPLEKEEIEIEIDGVTTKTQYVQLESMADYGSNGKGDLLGRDQAGVPSGILSDIRFSGDNIKDTLFGGKLYLRIHQNDEVYAMEPIETGRRFSFNIGSPPMPFHPEFGLYMQMPDEGPVVKIAPKPKNGDDAFSVRLSTDVAGAAEYEQVF
ncbi:MAG: hypothetical protein LBL31_06220 [Spirochaetaceae bacterium]|jgi:hypothetical protein|nr:hypothetical protein [Spirochaetaceae bacterium]